MKCSKSKWYSLLGRSNILCKLYHLHHLVSSSSSSNMSWACMQHVLLFSHFNPSTRWYILIFLISLISLLASTSEHGMNGGLFESHVEHGLSMDWAWIDKVLHVDEWNDIFSDFIHVSLTLKLRNYNFDWCFLGLFKLMLNDLW